MLLLFSFVATLRSSAGSLLNFENMEKQETIWSQLGLIEEEAREVQKFIYELFCSNSQTSLAEDIRKIRKKFTGVLCSFALFFYGRIVGLANAVAPLGGVLTLNPDDIANPAELSFETVNAAPNVQECDATKPNR